MPTANGGASDKPEDAEQMEEDDEDQQIMSGLTSSMSTMELARVQASPKEGDVPDGLFIVVIKEVSEDDESFTQSIDAAASTEEERDEWIKAINEAAAEAAKQ